MVIEKIYQKLIPKAQYNDQTLYHTAKFINKLLKDDIISPCKRSDIDHFISFYVQQKIVNYDQLKSNGVKIKFRLIANASDKRDGTESFNDGVSDEDAEVQYIKSI